MQIGAFLQQQFDADVLLGLLSDGVAEILASGQCQGEGPGCCRLPQRVQRHVDMRDTRGDGLVGSPAQRFDRRLRFPAQRCLAGASLAGRIAQYAEPGLSILKLPCLLQQRMAGREYGNEQQELQDMAADEA